jgi:hypothetical protein
MTMILRALTMLNETGDTTIVWTQDRDAEMERIIEKKMAEGCTFYLIEPRFGTREVLTDPRNANRHRMLAIPDSDFAAFVGGPVDPAAGAELHTSAAVRTPAVPIKSVRRAKTAKEVATAESVGTRPRRGG